MYMFCTLKIRSFIVLVIAVIPNRHLKENICIKTMLLLQDFYRKYFKKVAYSYVFNNLHIFRALK
jgi:hypothetical protein